jgi:TNF receptor-associated protein 1
MLTLCDMYHCYLVLLLRTIDTTESSPYYETFKKNDIECLFVYNTIDDFVMSNLSEYNGRKIVSAEKDDFDLGTANKHDASDAKVFYHIFNNDFT